MGTKKDNTIKNLPSGGSVNVLTPQANPVTVDAQVISATSGPARDGELRYPMYIRIAMWALAQARPVTRGDIARQFRISPRRAADMMMYIEGQGSHLIDCERVVSQVTGRRKVAVLHVTAVHQERYAPCRPGRPAGSRRAGASEGAPQHMRDLALGRRPTGRQS